MSFLKKFIKNFFFIELLKGLRITGKYLFLQKITIEYPEEKTPKSIRFRGLHALRRYDNGDERCIACQLCVTACPTVAISLTSACRSDGIRYAVTYNIDLFKCVYCGLCGDACPVGAIVQTNVSEFHFEKRGQEIINKHELLLNGSLLNNSISESQKEIDEFL